MRHFSQFGVAKHAVFLWLHPSVEFAETNSDLSSSDDIHNTSLRVVRGRFASLISWSFRRKLPYVTAGDRPILPSS